ncbi:MAG: SIR2 family protein [Campylobacteraceae bacterium]
MKSLINKIKDGTLVPFISMGVFKDTACQNGAKIPFDSDSFILSLNNGRAMSPRLMYEYSRAAMSIEQRKGRPFLEQLTNHVFTSSPYEIPKIYELIKELLPPFVVDLNLDDSLLKIYSNTEHFLITGISRITAENDRYIIYKFNKEDKSYKLTTKEELNSTIPILFKPLGCVVPDKNFIISDADFVDWLTEAMGGHALPPFLKEYRKDKEYLFVGIDFDRDTFRMVANEITIGLKGGYLINDKTDVTKKEDKFLKSHNIEKLNISIGSFLEDILS